METKPWYLSKGVWGGILVIIGAAGKILATGEINPEDIATFGVGLGLIGIRFKQN
jgi:hypothetical protein